jgi:hypothetical protein
MVNSSISMLKFKSTYILVFLSLQHLTFFFFFRNNSKSLRLDNGVSQGDNSAMGGAESDMDLSTSKASEPQEGSNSKLMCENIYCLDHLKVFKFASHKERHDR